MKAGLPARLPAPRVIQCPLGLVRREEYTIEQFGLPIETIRGELQKILASRTFRAADGQRKFLGFAVQEALEGRGHLLKEYSIGVEVFRRGESFDPRMNAIVRLEARKLRSRLARYYESEGRGDPIWIEFPKGSYTPAFRPFSAPNPLPSERSSPQASKPGFLSIAVLPFVNRSDEEDGELFSDGLTDELTSALGHLPGLRVVARTSAFQFKGEAVDVRQIGRTLNVHAVIEGSVRKHGTKLRIVVQLNETENGFRLWSGSYDRKLQEAMTTQQEVSRTITKALGTGLFKNVSTRRVPQPFDEVGASEPEAYQDYVQGRHHWYKQTPKDLATAIGYFEQAISKFPGYAQAYAALASCFATVPFTQAAQLFTLATKIRASASKALELDRSVGEAHSALAVARIYDFDWPGAEKEFRRGVELNPDDSLGHEWYGMYLFNVGRIEEAFEQRKKALEINPDSAAAMWMYAVTFYYLRRFEPAIEYFRKALAMEPDFAPAHVGLGLACVQRGNYTRGIAELELALRLVGNTPRVRAHLGYAHAMAGNREAALPILDDFLKEFPSDSFPALAIAEVYIGLKDKDRAFEWLHKAIDQRDWVVFLKSDPLFDTLRPDPRFATLLRRMNLS